MYIYRSRHSIFGCHMKLGNRSRVSGFRRADLAILCTREDQCFRIRPNGHIYIHKNTKYVEYWNKGVSKGPEFLELCPKFESWK